jgi:probable rRNA maturation factor
MDRPPSPQTRRRPAVDDESTAVLVTDDQEDEGDRRFPVEEPRWAALASAVLHDAGVVGPAELNVSFVDEPAMAELNLRYMGESSATDVLAFPIDDAADPISAGSHGAPRLLGDVVICPGVAARNAPEHTGSYDDEVALLVVHGVLHVLGMDHDDDESRRAMQQRERALLDEHHGAMARDPWR